MARLERVSMADDWAAGLSCDNCGTRAPNWEEGLFSIDREIGMFTCDLVLCPGCASHLTGVTSMQEADIAYWDWYWWTAVPPEEGK